MPTKYPCGICNIGVKYSGIKCTGLCAKWYHAGCQNILEKDLKKRATHEIEKWHCMACRISETPPLPNRIVDSETLNTSDTLLELEMSLIENNLIEGSNSREDDLQMAAKIGSALVAENELLKSEKLALQSKLISMEGKLEEMENIESKYLTKIENLLQLNSDIQAQLENEKKLRIEIQNSSEDNDLKLGQMIDNYAKQIVELEKSNSILQEKIQNTEITAVVCKSSYSQTSPMGDAQIYETNQTAVLLEISKMNSKLDQMELSIKTMASSAFCQNINDTLAGPNYNARSQPNLQKKTEQYPDYITNRKKSIPNLRSQSNLQPKTVYTCKDNKGKAHYCLTHDRCKPNDNAMSQPNLQKKTEQYPDYITNRKKSIPNLRSQSNLQPKTVYTCKDNKGRAHYCLNHDRCKPNYNARSQSNLQ
ncbi:hypothetical protein J6590_071372 [Homalodisca vitripennis]|nr:hypothetical protein J6590_071372 [Homalodisca vitripennis]